MKSQHSYHAALTALTKSVEAKRPISLDRRLEPPDTWRDWLELYYPSWVRAGFGRHHVKYWEHIESIDDARPDPYINIWFREGGKSTSLELACVYLAANDLRKVFLYVSDTQDQADEHISAIGTLLESPTLERSYPELTRKRLNKFGYQTGWTHSRLMTASGHTFIALGLKSAVRGIKIDLDRVGVFIFDDLDGELDSPRITERKKQALTKKILPTGGPAPVILGGQNLILESGIFNQLRDASAGFLLDRRINGPVKAVENLEYETQIDASRRMIVNVLGGEPNWSGFDLTRVAQTIQTVGPNSFLTEYQHELALQAGQMYSDLDFDAIRVRSNEVPELVRIVGAVDPAVTDSDNSDSHAIQIDGDAGFEEINGALVPGRIYRLYSWEERSSPESSIKLAVRQIVTLARRYNVARRDLVVETNQGGLTWKSVFRLVVKELIDEAFMTPEETPVYLSVHAPSITNRKVRAANQQLAAYNLDSFRHVEGATRVLERALYRFPMQKPFDLADASYWAWATLRPASPQQHGAKRRRSKRIY